MSITSLMDRVRLILQERDISQAAFARQIEVSPQAVSAWFSGRNRPGVEEVARMCQVLRVSPSWLITGSEDSTMHQSIVCENTAAGSDSHRPPATTASLLNRASRSMPPRSPQRH